MRSLKDLKKEAKWGKLTDEELNYVVHRIKAIDQGSEKNDDLSSLLYILGRSKAIQHRELMEKFIRYPSDDLACAEALDSLCRWWGLVKDYVEDLKFYIRGADWDTGDFVRIAALSHAGSFLRWHGYDHELLQLLLDVFENLGKDPKIKDTDDDSRHLIQSWAYSAIAEAMGKHPLETDCDAVEKSMLEGNRDALDLTVIQKAKQMLRERR